MPLLSQSPTETQPGLQFSQAMESIPGRLDLYEDRLRMLETELKVNTDLTFQSSEFMKENRETLVEIKDLLMTAKTFFKFCRGFGTGVKWLGGVAAGLAAIWGLIYAVGYALMHAGKMPPP